MLKQVFAADLQAPATPNSRSLLTVSQFARRHDCFSESSLRYLIFHSQPRHSSKGKIPGNGLAPAIRRIGRKVLIDETRFFEWLDSQNGGGAHENAR